jgi:hypothetical protein
MRQSLLRERVRRGLNDGRGTVVAFGERRRNYLVARAGRERGRESSTEGASEQGGSGRAGRGALKGRGRAEVAGERADVDASTTETWAGG